MCRASKQTAPRREAGMCRGCRARCAQLPWDVTGERDFLTHLNPRPGRSHGAQLVFTEARGKWAAWQVAEAQRSAPAEVPPGGGAQLPEAIVPLQDVHDSAHRGGEHPVHGEQGPVSPPLVMGGDAAVLDAQALCKRWAEKGPLTPQARGGASRNVQGTFWQLQPER